MGTRSPGSVGHEASSQRRPLQPALPDSPDRSNARNADRGDSSDNDVWLLIKTVLRRPLASMGSLAATGVGVMLGAASAIVHPFTDDAGHYRHKVLAFLATILLLIALQHSVWRVLFHRRVSAIRRWIWCERIVLVAWTAFAMAAWAVDRPSVFTSIAFALCCAVILSASTLASIAINDIILGIGERTIAQRIFSCQITSKQTVYDISELSPVLRLPLLPLRSRDPRWTSGRAFFVVLGEVIIVTCLVSATMGYFEERRVPGRKLARSDGGLSATAEPAAPAAEPPAPAAPSAEPAAPPAPATESAVPAARTPTVGTPTSPAPAPTVTAPGTSPEIRAKQTFEEVCGREAPRPAQFAADAQAHAAWAVPALEELYFGRQGIGAASGCPGVGGVVSDRFDTVAYQINKTDGQVTSVAVVSKRHGQALVLGAPGRSLADRLTQGVAASASQRHDVANGDLYFLYVKGETFAFVRFQKSQPGQPEEAWPYTELTPAVTEAWTARMTAEDNWLWPVARPSPGSSGTLYELRSSSGGAQEITTISYDPITRTASVNGGSPRKASGDQVTWEQIASLADRAG